MNQVRKVARYVSKRVDYDELYRRFWYYKEKGDKFLASNKGIGFRVGFTVAMIIVYPVANIVVKGPLLSSVFHWRYNITTELDERLKRIIDKQSLLWLEKEGASESDTFFTFSCLEDANHGFDSIRIGTLARSTGAQIALPFYVRFKNEKEAMEYAKNHLQPFDVYGRKVAVIWDSDLGRQLISTFVLSDEAIAFLVTRDLYGVQKSYVVTQEALSWFCYLMTFLCSFFGLHMFAFKGDSLVFVMALPVTVAVAIYGSIEWNKLAIYATEFNSDIVAAQLSSQHIKGGQEYYTKLLTRNRILRELIPDGHKLFTPIGDKRHAIAKYVTRYDELKNAQSENEELTYAVQGDDLQE